MISYEIIGREITLPMISYEIKIFPGCPMISYEITSKNHVPDCFHPNNFVVILVDPIYAQNQKCNIFSRQFLSLVCYGLRGGVQASQLGKLGFEIWVEGQGQDMSRHFGGGLGSMRTILPM